MQETEEFMNMDITKGFQNKKLSKLFGTDTNRDLYEGVNTYLFTRRKKYRQKMRANPEAHLSPLIWGQCNPVFLIYKYILS